MLHIVNRLPLDQTLLERLSGGDTLLLIENAVYGARSHGASAPLLGQALGRLRVCALGPDLTARGIDAAEVMAGVDIVDYAGFVQLTVDNPVIHSWS